MTTRIPDLPTLSGTQGNGSMLAYWSAAQDRTFKVKPNDLLGYFNVKLFGAKGDGIADDTAAIQAAIAACSTAGGTVYFPVGDYLHTGITIPTRAIKLVGETRTHFNVAYGSNLFYGGVTNGNWITVSGSADGITIESLHLRRSSSVVLTGGIAIDFQNATNFRIFNVKIVEAWNGLNVQNSAIGNVDDLYIGNYSGAYGCRLAGDAGDATTGMRIADMTCAAAAFNGNALSIEGNVATCWFYRCYTRDSDIGVMITGDAVTYPGLLYFEQHNSERCANEGFYLLFYGSVYLTDCWAGTCGVTSIGGSSASAFRFGTGGQYQLVRVSGCNAGSAGRHGYHIEPSLSRISMVNCAALGCSVDTINTWSGVRLDDNVANIQTLGGQFGANNIGDITVPKMQYGISIGAGCTNIFVSDADLRGNVTSAVLDGSAGTGNIKFTDCLGYTTEASGTAASVTPDANGNVTINHGMSDTPTYANVMLLGDTVNNGVEVQSVGATTIVARIYNEATGADVAAGTFSIMWHARTARA